MGKKVTKMFCFFRQVGIADIALSNLGKLYLRKILVWAWVIKEFEQANSSFVKVYKKVNKIVDIDVKILVVTGW